jgi:hypothetical protein
VCDLSGRKTVGTNTLNHHEGRRHEAITSRGSGRKGRREGGREGGRMAKRKSEAGESVGKRMRETLARCRISSLMAGVN